MRRSHYEHYYITTVVDEIPDLSGSTPPDVDERHQILQFL